MGNRKTSLGCLFWLALLLFAAVIILANLKTANEIIKKTGFRDVISELMEKKENNRSDDPGHTQPGEEEPEAEQPPVEPQEEEDLPGRDRESDDPGAMEMDEDDTPPGPEPTENPAPVQEETKKKLRRALIYFVQVNDEGAIQLKGFERPVYYVDSPLTQTLLTLLKGPNAREINMEYYSMIPEETKLNNIYVKGDVAYIDFNEQFRFNPLGKEGLKAQLNQVVYTVTEFSNVTRLQILIDGKKVNYLGPEGIYIGEPLSRSSLIAAD